MLCRMPRESSSSGSWRRELANALRDKRATVGVVGLGYVGLPMLVCAAKAGFRAVGLDVDPTRVEALSEGRSYVSDVPNEVLADIRASLRVSTKPNVLRVVRRRPDLRSDAADRQQPRPRVHRTRGALGRRVASRWRPGRPRIDDLPGNHRGGPPTDPGGLGPASGPGLRPRILARAYRPRTRARSHREDPEDRGRTHQGRRRARRPLLSILHP